MTENLLQKLEERLINLLDELDVLHSEIDQLRQENQRLKSDKTNFQQKLHHLVALLETFDAPATNEEQGFLEAEAYAEAVPA